MCGIVAVVQSDHRPVVPQVLEEMRDALAHRGPDDAGSYVADWIGLGHRRLAIIDLNPRARQPMCNEDETVWVVLNGEIYNYLELREGLLKRGHHFKSESDTEVILHLYEEQGDECIHRLRGMFAFILWDSRRRRLVAARDRLGKKPLYYARVGPALLLASEIKALLRYPGLARRPDLRAMHHYLALQYVPSPHTAFEGIHRLPPAHLLTWEDGSLALSRYWTPRYVPKLNLGEPETVERFSELLREAVRLRLRADVPWGLHLSGGLDSSAIAAVAAEVSPRLHTFSVGFQDFGYDERAYARQVAERLGTHHHELVLSPDILKILPRLVYHYDQPFADPAALPTFALSEATREHVTVALNGDGGDENLGGYPRYGGNAYWRLFRGLPRLLRQARLWRLASRALPPVLGDALFRAYTYGSESPEQHYCRAMSHFTPEWLRRLYSEDMRVATASWDPYEPLGRAFRSATESGLGSLDTLLSVDLETYLPDCLLVKVDVASMAWGLEVRSPFLDHLLVEFVARLPESYKVRGNIPKYLLKRACARLLPPQILARQKAGFVVPLGRWLRHSLRAHVRDLLMDGLTRRGYFRPETIQMLIDRHQDGTRDHAALLWNLMVLEVWHQVFVDSAGYKR